MGALLGRCRAVHRAGARSGAGRGWRALAQQPGCIRRRVRYGCLRESARLQHAGARPSARGKRHTHHRVPEPGATGGGATVYFSIRGYPAENPRRHRIDRKSTRLNSSHLVISYAVFCLKKYTIVGVLRGFIREIVALVCWIVGLWAAWTFGPQVEPYLGGYLADPTVRPWVGRLVVLVIVLIAGYLVGLVLSTLLRSAGLG